MTQKLVGLLDTIESIRINFWLREGHFIRTILYLCGCDQYWARNVGGYSILLQRYFEIRFNIKRSDTSFCTASVSQFSSIINIQSTSARFCENEKVIFILQITAYIIKGNKKFRSIKCENHFNSSSHVKDRSSTTCAL